MMFGVVLVGTYTSIFIAAPILIYLGVGDHRADVEDKQAKPDAAKSDKPAKQPETAKPEKTAAKPEKTVKPEKPAKTRKPSKP
jgi:preprotein translocase subunit SecF